MVVISSAESDHMVWDHDMGHNEAINPSISSRSAESAISSPCLGTLANDGS